jgi:hypothetical protein
LSWNQQFFDPIELPGGRKLVTLRDAALCITNLPKAEHDAEEWQAAMAALLLVAEHDGPTMFARIGVMRALNQGDGRETKPWFIFQLEDQATVGQPSCLWSFAPDFSLR